MRPLGWILLQYDWCPYKKVRVEASLTYTEGRRCEDTGITPSVNQGYLREIQIGGKYGTDLPSQPSEETIPADTMILGFWPQNC